MLPLRSRFKRPILYCWVMEGWLGDRDSNPGQRHQKPQFCRWTIAQYKHSFQSWFHGLDGEIRTPDRPDPNRELYQTEPHRDKKDWVRFKLTTCDLINALLYLLSYQSIIYYIIKIISSMIFRIIWYGRWDSNPRLLAWKASVQTARRRPHGAFDKTWTCDLPIIGRML